MLYYEISDVAKNLDRWSDFQKVLGPKPFEGCFIYFTNGRAYTGIFPPKQPIHYDSTCIDTSG
jgi:hypothetical protein